MYACRCQAAITVDGTGYGSESIFLPFASPDSDKYYEESSQLQTLGAITGSPFPDSWSPKTRRSHEIPSEKTINVPKRGEHR
jgi:hypothetical protein